MKWKPVASAFGADVGRRAVLRKNDAILRVRFTMRQSARSIKAKETVIGVRQTQGMKQKKKRRMHMKTGKRLLSVLLAVLLSFGCASAAWATGEPVQTKRVFEKVEKNENADGTVLLIWFVRTYTVEGGDYSVTVDLSGDRTYTVPQEEIRRAVSDRTSTGVSGTQCVLFVHLPTETLHDMVQMRVSADVFRSSSAEESPAFRITHAHFSSGNAAAIDLRCKATVTGLEKLGYRVVPHSSMTVSCIFRGITEITYDGVPVEGKAVDDVGGEGEHILRAEIAPGLYEQIVLRVDSPAKAYLRSLGQHTVYMMMVPFALLSVLPIGFAALLTLPGFAYVALAPVGWSVTAVKEFFQSFASAQGKEHEFRPG